MPGFGGTECTSCFNPHGAMGIEDTASYAYICVTLRVWIKSAAAMHFISYKVCASRTVYTTHRWHNIQHVDGIIWYVYVLSRHDLCNT